MYPHEIDRLRILQFIFKRLREHVSQDELAVRSGINQSAISNLQHLVKDGKVRRSTRKNLLSALGHGLKLPREEVDALLWLFDGTPLSPGEINRVIRSYAPLASESPTQGQLDGAFKATVLRLLQKTVRSENSKAEVRMRFNSGATARLGELREFLEYESQPGQRLFASTIPTSLVHSETCLQSQEMTPQSIRDAGEEAEFQSLYKQRQQAFLSNLKSYGERSIHSRSTLQRYATEPAGHFTPMPLRHRQIQNWIKLLDHHPNYEIGLTDEVPLLELGVKTTPVALIRGVRQDRSRNNPIWGVHHIFWTDEDSVFSFILSFEHAWESLPSEARDKAKVISYLESLLPPILSERSNELQ
jgi:hypothetical protein